ncbi:proteasome stabiliser-domain-containing protein [Macrophomina phaseolina]|uniref:Proteasome stabiliser-domain-containing protein n=1 Tax=Macrophomina phaseolina TaxID=35725 RepID=A0ABQ8GPF5_9PEZI|nr:proteasome stabiliser-domain-containing protein [Macrophomina phaseolina]
MSSPEERELSLIGKVELRIALADTDAKLQSILNTYLAPLLLKLASEHVSVRNKVISVCQHINTRVRPQEIRLPVAALLKQFKDHPDSPLIRHFDLLYIQQGISRLPLSERLSLLPPLINGIATDTARSVAHGSQLFNLLVRLLAKFELPPRGSRDDEQLREKLAVSNEDAKFLSFWFGKLILFTPVRAGPNGSNVACPGLAPDEYQFLTLQGKPGVWDPSAEGGMSLTEAKVTVCKFLASGMFTDEERFFPAVFASAESNSRISEIGDDILKRAVPNTDLESPLIISSLYDIYFGTSNGQLQARPALKIKILSFFVKSTAATTFTSNVTRLVEEGLTYGAVEEGSNAAANGSSARGREVTKLRAAIFSFVNFMARRGSAADLHAVGPTLVQRLRAFIEDQGWPKPNPDEDVALRGYVYEVIGLLAKAAPEGVLLEPNLNLLRWLFRSLSDDTSGRDTGVSIDEALSSVLGALATSSNAEVQRSLRDLLLEQMSAEDESNAGSSTSSFRRSTRYAAVRFANRCLPYKDVVARWIDLLAVSGPASESQEVREEGHRGLDPHWSRLLHSSQRGVVAEEPHGFFPDFAELSIYVLSLPEVSAATRNAWRPNDQVRHFKRYYPHAFAPTVKFCHQILMDEALRTHGMAIPVDVDWARKLDTAVSTDAETRNAVKTYLKRAASEQGSILHSVLALMRAALEGLLWKGGVSLDDLGEKFVQLCSLSPDDLLDMSQAAPAFRALEPCIFSNHEPTRNVAAHVYGLLATHSAVVASEADQSLSLLLERADMWEKAVGGQVNESAGAILAVAYYFSRLTARKRRASASEEKLQHLLKLILDILRGSTDRTLRDATSLAISELSLFFVVKAERMTDIAKINFTLFTDKLFETAKSGNEKAILALGHLAMIVDDESDPNLDFVRDKIFELHEIRQTETQFAVGEAVSCLAGSWDATILAPRMDIDAPIPSAPSRAKTLPRVLEKVLKNCRNTKPALRKASVIWLLSIIQFLGHLNSVKSRLPECQSAFKSCLSDRDEVVQEAASRGLGLVYEKGDRQLKDDLVRDLVSSFSDNKPNLSGNVQDDTQLFEPGALPTGDGSVTTYKDILNLASEVGDSSLVYRFMSLAANNAIWSSRAAFGRFGLSNVLSDSSVNGYLAENPKLYPKLFRYRFDPNPNVQRSMKDIWNALVKDSAATVDKYFDAIMEDLLQNILGKEWRVRQAACAAVADLVQGRSVDKYEQYLGRIWTACFKVLDDIKESVRAAAGDLARVLTAILTRSLEAGDTSAKNADTMLKNVLPFLLSTSGLESGAREVQFFALETLLEIIKKSSAKILRPYIPELIERLVGLLSSIEPEGINYIHLNASKYNLTEQKIDDMRLASVRGSPLMEAIERCLDLLDDDSMKALEPRLQNAMKAAIGLPSKVGASRVLVSLATRRGFLFKPYADHFLKIIEKHVHDRNETVSAAYAAAAGYVSRIASDNQILELIAFCKRMYFESDDERHRTESGDIVAALSKHASDRFLALSTDLLPFIYVAKYDNTEAVRELFSRAWDENVGGSLAVQLYVKDIVKIAQGYLDSPRWTLKHTAAKAIAEATNALASTVEDISLPNAETIWPALDKALGGKSWEGKEIVLQAFARFVERGGAFWKTRQDVADQIKKVVVREAKRQNKTYRQHALKPLGRIAAARTDLDWSEIVSDIVTPVADELTEGDEDAMDVDAGEGLWKDEKLRDNTATGAIFALQASINPKLLQDTALSGAALRALSLVRKINTLPSNAIHVATFEALQSLFDRVFAQEPTGSFSTGNEMQLKDVLEALLFDDRYDGLSEAMRIKRAQAMHALAKLPERGFARSLLVGRLGKEIEQERSPVVRAELEKAKTAKTMEEEI